MGDGVYGGGGKNRDEKALGLRALATCSIQTGFLVIDTHHCLLGCILSAGLYSALSLVHVMIMMIMTMMRVGSGRIIPGVST